MHVSGCEIDQEQLVVRCGSELAGATSCSSRTSPAVPFTELSIWVQLQQQEADQHEYNHSSIYLIW